MLWGRILLGYYISLCSVVEWWTHTHIWYTLGFPTISGTSTETMQNKLKEHIMWDMPALGNSYTYLWWKFIIPEHFSKKRFLEFPTISFNLLLTHWVKQNSFKNSVEIKDIADCAMRYSSSFKRLYRVSQKCDNVLI